MHGFTTNSALSSLSSSPLPAREAEEKKTESDRRTGSERQNTLDRSILPRGGGCTTRAAADEPAGIETRFIARKRAAHAGIQITNQMRGTRSRPVLRFLLSLPVRIDRCPKARQEARHPSGRSDPTTVRLPRPHAHTLTNDPIHLKAGINPNERTMGGAQSRQAVITRDYVSGSGLLRAPPRAGL